MVLKATPQERLQAFQSRMHFSLSLQPLYAYSTDDKAPFLGFFEDSAFFPYLVLQLFAWSFYVTFFASFGAEGIFELVALLILRFHAYFRHHDSTGSDLGLCDSAANKIPFGRKCNDESYCGRSPALVTFTLLPSIFLFAPAYSLLWTLSCPCGSSSGNPRVFGIFPSGYLFLLG
jgi:hypothetical protein